MKKLKPLLPVLLAALFGATAYSGKPPAAPPQQQPGQVNSGHTGTEQGESVGVASQVLGQDVGCDALTATGGTPNHKALRAALAYGCWIRHHDRAAGRAAILAFLNEQLRTLMSVGGVSEFETSSHYAWWQASYAGIWIQAFRAGDPEILGLIRQVMIRVITVERACSTPGGHVVIPGGRAFGGGDADQRQQRDQGLAWITGQKVRLPAEVLDAKVRPASTDRIGLWLLTLLPRAELAGVASAPAVMPSLQDALQIQTGPGGHVAWFDDFHGLKPAYFAWVDYATGKEVYGVDPTWPKGFPGGPRPASLVVPAIAGKSVTHTYHLGLTAPVPR